MLINADELLERLYEARDEYKDSTELVERAIRVGIDRAISEVVLSQAVRREP